MNIDERYIEIFKNVKAILAESDKFYEIYPFRKRSEHIWRVFIWANRLTENYYNINKDALFIAALFHDTGYAISLSSKEHAKNSEEIFKDYCKKYSLQGIDENYIAYLVRNHSNKELLNDKNSFIELIMLMEADILDETGAMAIVWDCMAEGGKEEQSFIKTYEHILNYTKRMMDKNIMVTEEGNKFWKAKQELVNEFLEHYKIDIGIEEKLK